MQASFLRLQTTPDFAEAHQMKAHLFLLGAGLLLAASCGDSDTGDNPRAMVFVQASEGAELTDTRLTLTWINEQTEWFTDRPEPESGQITTEEFLALWEEGENSFADNPPSADFACTVDGTTLAYVVELRAPALFSSGCERDFCAPSRLTYDIEFLSAETVDDDREIRCESPAKLLIDGTEVEERCAAFENDRESFEECILDPGHS